jgi:hypothetical protein
MGVRDLEIGSQRKRLWETTDQESLGKKNSRLTWATERKMGCGSKARQTLGRDYIIEY